MISLVTKKSKINLANTNTGIEIEQQGAKDITLTPEESSIDLTVSNDSIELKENYIKGDKGEDGKDGKDGFSPTIDVIAVDEGHKFVITDVEGTEEVIIKDGKDGKDGESGGAALVEGDNTVIEDNAINVYTNTGYKVSDKDIKIQAITDSGTNGTNKMLYIEEEEITFIYDGSNKIRRSANGIDFEIIELPLGCKSLIYKPSNKRIIGLTYTNNFIYSDDFGDTWNSITSNFANGATYLFSDSDATGGFKVINTSTRRIASITEKWEQSSGILTSSVTPSFMTKLNANQIIWCNSTGSFKYGAGSIEGNFVSILGVVVNVLKTVNGYPIVGLKNDNQIYRIKATNMITGNEWIAYELPQTCTVNDINFNPYDETYYIFTDINTYYKTKDFIEYESVDKDGLRGEQGYFTLMGIQTTVKNERNQLLLAPTRTTLENKAQEWDRALNKELWVGQGLKLNGDKVEVQASSPIIVGKNGVYLDIVDDYHLAPQINEGIALAFAPIYCDIDPYAFDSWYWEFGFPVDMYSAQKVVFNQEGSFWNQLTWEEEYFVEQYEYGYVFSNMNDNSFKYVKLGNLAPLFN